MSLLAFIGLFSATCVAYMLEVDRGKILAGLMGYNGLLVGAALGNILPGPWEWQAPIATIFCGALSTVPEVVHLMFRFSLWQLGTSSLPLGFPR